MPEIKKKVTVIIPVKNEEGEITRIIEDARPYADEVLVVDGHSTDATPRLASEAGARVVSDNGRGKGDGMRTGIKEASGDILVFIDGDGSHEAGDIPALVQPLLEDKADLVVASRMLGGSDELHGTVTNFIRMAGSCIVALILNYRWGCELTDCENGFRAVRRDVALNLNLRANDFDIEQEMLMKVLKKGYRVTEVASHEYKRKSGKSKLPTSRGWKFIWRLIVEFF